MGYKKVNEDSLTAIGNAIRSKTGGNAPLAFPGNDNAGMVAEIKSIGGQTVNVQQSKAATITGNNQSITPDSGYDAMAQVTAALGEDVYKVAAGKKPFISESDGFTVSVGFTPVFACAYMISQQTTTGGKILCIGSAFDTDSSGNSTCGQLRASTSSSQLTGITNSLVSWSAKGGGNYDVSFGFIDGTSSQKRNYRGIYYYVVYGR